MIKLIVGTKGSGKTKTMIDMINDATKTATGNVVVIEKSMQLTTSINHAARLVDVDEYKISGADMLYGFVTGVLAGNYDITNMFIDGILKVCGQDMEAAGRVLNAINAVAGDSVKVVVTISAQAEALPDSIKKFL